MFSGQFVMPKINKCEQSSKHESKVDQKTTTSNIYYFYSNPINVFSVFICKKRFHMQNTCSYNNFTVSYFVIWQMVILRKAIDLLNYYTVFII